MSTAILPSLAGLGFDVIRTPQWSTKVQTAISGKEVRIGLWTFPIYKWELLYNVLRTDANAEFQNLIAFFNERQGQFDTFLYQDATDNAVMAQDIGTGDGVSKTFQLVKSFGGYVEPVFAPNTGGTVNIYLNGALQGSGYTISAWGSSTPGVLTFTSAPGSGVVITADFSYFYPCRISEDSLPFNMFLSGMYAVKKFAFQSVKN